MHPKKEKKKGFWGSWAWKHDDPSRASTCVDICLKLSLLSSPAVPHFICLSALGFTPTARLRRARPRAAPQIRLFLTLGKLWRASGCLDKIRRWTTVNTGKNVPISWLLRGLMMIFIGCRLGFACGFGSCCC